MSEPITYRIAFDFTTNRPLTLDELIDLGGQAYTQVNEPNEEQENEDDPYDTAGVEMRLWVGEDEVAGLNEKPVYHAHVAYFEFFEEGHFNRPSDEADDFDWHCFADEAEAEALAEIWLAEGYWAKGSRVNVGVRMIAVPEWVHIYLESSKNDEEANDKWLEWSPGEVWNKERRVGERMRVWLA